MEMSKVVAGWCARDEDVSFFVLFFPAWSIIIGTFLLTWDDFLQGVELSAILKLPLTGDARLMHTAEISRRYYSMVMASAH